MNYGSMMNVYGWMMKKHQPIGNNYQPIQDDDDIEDSLTQYYMEFNEDHRGDEDFEITFSLKQSLRRTRFTVQKIYKKI